MSTPDPADKGNHWARYPANWGRVKAPLRVNASIVQAFSTAMVRARPGGALMLGMTPELVPLFDDLDVVDRNPAMLQSLWQGDNAGRHAFAMDWLVFQGRGQHPYQVVAGDGSLNNAESADNLRDILRHAHHLLAPGGWMFCRLFERPVTPFTLQDLKSQLLGERGLNFHAFKWMLAMYLAEHQGMRVPVSCIHGLFHELCPDMGLVSKNTGWPLEEIRTIEVYKGSTVSYVFPNRAEIQVLLPVGVVSEFLPTGEYDLSACCPLMAYQKST